MEKVCKIVQDILPTYIEKMTSEETNVFVEEHLKECDECKKIYKTMLEDINKENIKNTEIVKTIKKYKRRIFVIKALISIIVLVFIIKVIGNIGFRFYVVNKAYERNTNYDVGGNFTIEEYEESIERYENHYTTYYKGETMKKMYGDQLMEYYSYGSHYYFDNEENQYYETFETYNGNVNIDISVIPGTENVIKNNEIDRLEILKFVIFKEDIYIHSEGFRNKEYYVIKNLDGQKIYVDKDTFFAERVVRDNTDITEYRITTGNVSYREVEEPDFSKYEQVKK